MTRRSRTRYTAEQKVELIRRHLIDKISVSELCQEYNLQPTVFYRWQQEFFEHGASAFQRDSSAQQRKTQKHISLLESKLQRKDEVLAELMEEYVVLKKTLGDP